MRSETSSWLSRPSAAMAAWLMLAIALAAAASATAEEATQIRVRYRSADAVYLDAGRLAGLAEGDRLAVVRGESVIAELEVIFVADHSASCRVLSERQTVAEGDLTRPSTVPAAGAPEPAAETVAGTEAAEPPDRVTTEARSGESSRFGSDVVSPTSSRGSSRSRYSSSPRMRLSGAITLDWESFVDDSGGDRYEFDETTARLSLRARNIGGFPYDLTIRMRTRENRRMSGLLSAPRTERQDRFYELSLAYSPEGGKLSYQVGRLGAGAFSGLGYLDGALGQWAITPSFKVGGFFGAAAEVDSLGFQSTGEKYGVFTRFASPRESGRRHRYDVVLAGVREIGELDVSREYVSLQTRISSGNRWSFYQWAELDLNNGWRKELAGTTSQLSNFVVTLMARMSETSRFTLSYNRFEQYRTEDTRSIPERLFNDLQRQGLRASLNFGKPRGFNLGLNAGLRDQEGEDEQTTSYGLSLRHGDVASWGLSLAASFLAFDNPTTDGYVATLRASKRLPGNHRIHLDLGDRLNRNKQFEDLADRSTQWARLGVWIELPRSLFTTAEYEMTTGDDLEGQRLNISLGYRF